MSLSLAVEIKNNIIGIVNVISKYIEDIIEIEK